MSHRRATGATYPVPSLLVIPAVSLSVVRVGRALGTGVTPEVASAQATSAFPGAGFTTDEAGTRRRDARAAGGREGARSAGKVGFVSVAASLLVAFTNATDGGFGSPVSILAGEKVLFLGVGRDETYGGAPDGDAENRPGDTVVLSATEHRLREPVDREAGDDAANEDAVAEHEGVVEERRRLGARP